MMIEQRRARETESAGLLDFSAIFGLIRRRLIPMIVTGLLVLLLVGIVYSLLTPKYTALANIALTRAQQDDLVAQPNNANKPLTTDSPSVDTEVQVISSPVVINRAVAKLRLMQRPDFRAAMKVQPGVVITADQAAAAIISGLVVKRQGLSYAISVSYTSSDSALSADIVNAVIDSYTNGQVDSEATTRARKIKLLGDQLGTLRAAVLTADSDVARFRAETNLIDIRKDSTAVQEQMSVLSTQLAQAKADEAVATAQANAATGSGGGTATINSPLVRDLRGRAADLSKSRAEISKRFGPLHPERVAIENQLAEVNAQIDREVARTRAATTSDAAVARRRTESIQASIDGSQRQLLAGNAASVRLDELQRLADSARQIYQSFLDQYRQQLATQGAERSNSYVISRAAVPSVPSSPNPLLFAVAAVVAAIGAAAMVAMLLELRERGVRTRVEAEEKLALPVLSSIPDLRTIKEANFRRGGSLEISDYLVAHDGSVFNESLRSLRTALKIGQPGQLARTVAVTSSVEGEGKTTTAICLARSAALAGYRALLVDCDLRRHSSTQAMTAGSTAGLVEVLTGAVPLEKALVRDEASGALILPQAPSAHPAFDIITSHAMAELLSRLSTMFDIVVLDTAPCLPVAESRGLAAMADATLLVVRWRKTPIALSRLAIDHLDRAGAKVVGTLLTQVDIRSRAIDKSEMATYANYSQTAFA